MKRLRLVILFCSLMAATAAAQSPAPRAHDITLEDYFTLGVINEIALSPDGTKAAWAEGRWQEDLDRRNDDLWVVDVATKTFERLTFDPSNESSPQWSADGAWVYFLTSRTREGEKAPPWDGSTQVWRMRPGLGPGPGAGAGEIMPVTRIAGGVQMYRIARDGASLYYVKGKDHVEPDLWKDLRTKFDKLEYGHGVVKYGQVFKLDLVTWREEMLVDEGRVIVEMAVSDDERFIAMITRPTEDLITNEGWSHVDVFDARTGRVSRLEDRLWRDEAPSPYGWIVNLAWSSDSAKLAFRVDFDGYPGEMFTAHFDGASAAEPAVTKLIRPSEVTVEGQMAWRPGTHDLWFIASDHARQRIYALRGIEPHATPSPETITPGDEVISAMDFSRDGRQRIVLRGGRTHTPDLFLLREQGDAAVYERLTNINPQVDAWKLPQISIVKWTSGDGTSVEGILELPPEFKAGDGPLPMVVAIHGGPTACSYYEFRYWIYGRTLFAAKGWAVFDPNYRGSTGYGDKFLTDLIENENDIEVQDIMAGVDAMIARGIADPERLAVMGWSNGGYLTNCLITATNRFKAASSGAGVLDATMQWSIEDTPGHVINYAGGRPWEVADELRGMSPLYDADHVTTPTLIHVGENDERVPAAHSRALHRALHHYLEVPCELVVYPGEGHGLTKMSHRRAKLMWDHAWFEQHVLGKSASGE